MIEQNRLSYLALVTRSAFGDNIEEVLAIDEVIQRLRTSSKYGREASQAAHFKPGIAKLDSKLQAVHRGSMLASSQ